MPDITMVPVQSSNIKEIGYDMESQTAAARFAGKEGADGPLYRYKDMPMEVYAAWSGAESVGKYFHANIRGKYAAEKVDE